MFDPKTVYGAIRIRECIGYDLNYQVELKDWPASELATIRVYAPDGREAYVLIAPGSTVENVEKELRDVAERLRRPACGGDTCGI